ncbi:haloacid dehalogenase type II [Aquipuribacter nitratireducens]|uniref:Haloacid dehalogenase type II n=1 Tax=Aquipuribacter nitratireducens TaxID=650104 RepID=A0ABW0GPW2_9MICO
MTPVVLLDVNETLTDMSGLDAGFADVLTDVPGAPAPPVVRGLWFARLLRDGFAATAAGSSVAFADLARVQAEQVLASLGHDDPATAAQHVLGGIAGLDLYPDAAPGLRRLAGSGARLVPFTNGATAVSDGAFERAGVTDLFETRLSVLDAGVWKPAGDAYRGAAERLGVTTADCTLVAVHPWDLMGAARAGCATAWVRRGTSWPAYFPAPDVEADDIGALAEAMIGS